MPPLPYLNHRRIKILAVISLSLVQLVGPRGAAAEPRIWTSQSGAFRIEAEYVDLDGTFVRLRRAPDQKMIRVPAEKLSEADLAFLLTKLERTIRIWTDVSGRFSTRATLLTCDDVDVVLVTVEGNGIRIPVERLGTDDRAYLAVQAGPGEAIADDPSLPHKGQSSSNVDMEPHEVDVASMSVEVPAALDGTLQSPDFKAPIGEHVGNGGRVLPDAIYSKISELLDEAVEIWPDSKMNTAPTADSIKHMVSLLASNKLVGSGAYCDCGLTSSGWGISIYGARPSPECNAILRLYVEGEGMEYEKLLETFGQQRREANNETSGVHHVLYGHVDVMYDQAGKYLGTVFFYERAPVQMAAAAVLNYPEVQKDISKYMGEKVSWVGKQVTYQTGTDKSGRDRETYIFLWRTDQGEFFADHPFVVPGAKLKRTAAEQKASNDPSAEVIRLVSGTISGSQECDAGNGRTFMAPVLKDVTMDVVANAEESSEAPLEPRAGVPFEAVYRNPAAHVGKTVTWKGKFSSMTGKRFIYIGNEQEVATASEFKFFAVEYPEDIDPPVGDDGTISGTVAGTVSIPITIGSPSGSRTTSQVEVPLLRSAEFTSE